MSLNMDLWIISKVIERLTLDKTEWPVEPGQTRSERWLTV
jgi:hypothetical protein